MSDPTVAPSLASIPAQMLAAVPAWVWRSTGSVMVVFAVMGVIDAYNGYPVSGLIRAYSAKNVEAVKAAPSFPTSPMPQMKPVADIGLLAARLSDLEKRTENVMFDQSGTMASISGDLKALEEITRFQTQRINDLSKRLDDRPKPPPVPVIQPQTVPHVARKIVTVPVAPPEPPPVVIAPKKVIVEDLPQAHL